MGYQLEDASKGKERNVRLLHMYLLKSIGEREGERGEGEMGGERSVNYS